MILLQTIKGTSVYKICTQSQVKKKDKGNFKNTPNTYNQISFKSYFVPKYSQHYDYYLMGTVKKSFIENIRPILKKDWQLSSKNTNNNISENDKITPFEELDYYLKLKEQNNNTPVQLHEYLKEQNPRKLSNEYKEAFNSVKWNKHVLPIYESVYKTLLKDSYFMDFSNKEIDSSQLGNYVEQKIDSFFLIKFNKERLKKKFKPFVDKSYLNTEYAQKKLKEFKTKYDKEYMYINTKDLPFFFEVLDKMLDTTDKTQYDFVIDNLKNLYIASKDDYEHDDSDTKFETEYGTKYTDDLITDINFEDSNNSWNNLRGLVIEYYENNILRDIVNDKEEKVDKLNKFLKSQNYKLMNYGNRLSMLFEYRGGGELTLSERIFLINKYNQAEKDKKSYGIDMLDFLANRPANNKIRKQIVRNLMVSQEIANESYDEIIDQFIDNLQNRNFDEKINNRKIGNKNLLDTVLTEINEKMVYMDHDCAKFHYIADMSKADLKKLFEKYRQQWLNDQFEKILNFESNKYDMSKQTDYLVSKFTVQHEGKDIPLNEFLDNIAKTICGQNADVNMLCKKILEFEKSGNKNLKTILIHDKAQYDALMSQMISLCDTLSQNNATSNAYFEKISKDLDKLEMNCPWLKPQVKDTRSFLQKLKDGLFNRNNIMPVFVGSGMIWESIRHSGKATMEASGGEPFTFSAGVIMYLLGLAFSIGNGIVQEMGRGK